MARSENDAELDLAGNEKAPTSALPPRPKPSKPREVTARPVPSAQQTDPRGFEIGQVVKRFTPKRGDTADGGTVLTFALKPSDPDFPFELAGGLRCTLTVPATYPQVARPVLRVTNQEMPRGYQINVENGFNELTRQAQRKSLLALLNELDRQLEQLLSSEKAQTLKITSNAPRQASAVPPRQDPAPREATAPESEVPQRVVYSVQEKNDARAKRDADVRQLEARMSKLPMYSKSTDGTIYNIPITVPKASQLPASLQAVKEVVLFVPELYNLEACTVHLKGIESHESENVEAAFEKYTRLNTSSTLMAHINYLTQHMRTMATEEVKRVPASVQPPAPIVEPADNSEPVQSEMPAADPDRPHLKLIARPPEWDNVEEDSGSASEVTDSEDYTDSTENEAEDGGAPVPAQSSLATTDRGISISFPDVELYGIELLEMASLALTLKCERCKTVTDISGLKPSTEGNNVIVSQACSKCAYELSASYRAEPVHAHNVRAGYLDLTSCTVQDMLPSVFAPTCSECSTKVQAPPGVVSVRGDTSLSICRSCHQKMTFKIPSVKFLRVSQQQKLLPSLPRRKGPRENLGITTGTPLPDNGRCTHYRKSYRWFRFSCCNKVYPCDRCHDEKSEPKHANEHANRMICGWCSREQNYRPQECGTCGRSMVAKKGSGFWEGGQGTRDPMRMSRKEPRKYKRVGSKNKAKENR